MPNEKAIVQWTTEARVFNDFEDNVWKDLLESIRNKGAGVESIIIQEMFELQDFI